MTNRQLLMLKADALTEAEAAEVLDYIGIMQSMNERVRDQLVVDEVLLKFLFKAYGNHFR